MPRANTEITIENSERRYPLVATFAVFLVAGVTLLVYGGSERSSMSVDTPLTSSSSAVGQTGPILVASLPTHITLPTVKIDADFEEPLGVQTNGEIDAPQSYDKVAYYKFGPTPGEVGPAVVLGHVDSKAGPAVFYSLGQLKPGDPIEIRRADGSIATFTVEKFERYPQNAFPTQAVYGDIPYAGLRLITCSGVYDRGVLRYSHNLVVFAKLASSTEPSLTPSTIL